MTEGYNPFTGFFLSPNLCSLSNEDTSGLQNGCLAYVEDVNRYYRYAANGTDAPLDGVYVVSTWTGPINPGCDPLPPGLNAHGTDRPRWILTNLADAIGTTANSTEWYIDAVYGNDNNIGTIQSKPLQTFRELGRRWRNGATYNTDYIFVTILSDHLLDDDVIDICRPLGDPNPSQNFPIVIQGTRQAPVFSGVIGPASVGVNHAAPASPGIAAGGHGVLLDVNALGLSYSNQFLRISNPSSPIFGAWMCMVGFYNSGAPPLDYTSPIVLQATAPSPTVAPDPALNQGAPIPGDNFNVLGTGCSIPDTIVLDIPSYAEVWFYDVELRQGTAPAPTAVQNIQSGVMRFYRSSGSSADKARLYTGPNSQVSLYFMGSTSKDIQILMRNPATSAGQSSYSLSGGLRFDASVYDNNNDIDANAVDFWNDSVFAPGAYVTLQSGRILTVVDLWIQANVAASIRSSGGAIFFNNALYGSGNTADIMQLGEYTKGIYSNASQLTVAANLGAAQSGTINYLNGVVKTFIPADLPFVSIATGADSQSGMIKRGGGI